MLRKQLMIVLVVDILICKSTISARQVPDGQSPKIRAGAVG